MSIDHGACGDDGFSARVRLAAAALGLVAVLASQRPSTGLCMACGALLGLALERVPPGRVTHILAAPWMVGGAAVLLRWWLGQPALLLGCRIAGATCVYAWLVCTATFSRMLAALAAFGTPRELVEMMSLALRYSNVFQGTVRTARDAQRLRLGYATSGRALRSWGVLAGLLVGRAVDQSATLAGALRLRGYTGRIPLPVDRAVTVRDLRLVAAAALLVGVSEWLP